MTAGRVQGGLHDLEVGEGLVVGEPVPAQGLMEPLHLPCGGGCGGLGEAMHDAVVPVDPIEEHLATPAGTSRELFAIVREHFVGGPPLRCSGPDEARHVARAVARRHADAMTQNRGDLAEVYVLPAAPTIGPRLAVVAHQHPRPPPSRRPGGFDDPPRVTRLVTPDREYHAGPLRRSS